MSHHIGHHMSHRIGHHLSPLSSERVRSGTAPTNCSAGISGGIWNRIREPSGSTSGRRHVGYLVGRQRGLLGVASSQQTPNWPPWLRRETAGPVWVLSAEANSGAYSGLRQSLGLPLLLLCGYLEANEMSIRCHTRCLTKGITDGESDGFAASSLMPARWFSEARPFPEDACCSETSRWVA